MANYSLQSTSGKLILTGAILASGMAFLDSSSTNIALPTIQSYFHANLAGIQWIANAYALALASFLMISGSLGDRYGHKRLFVYGIILFLIASTLSAISRNITQLIVFQGVQGFAAAIMIPQSLAIINTSFAEETRGKAIGIWSGFSAGIAALGPFMGGWLVQVFNWPSVFWINLPIGLLALLFIALYVPETQVKTSTKLDWPATVLIVLGLFGISFGLMQAPTAGWHTPYIWASLVGGLACLIALIFVERRSPNPLIPLHIFKSPLVLGSNLLTLCLYFALYGMMFFFVLNLRQVQGLSPIFAGLATLPGIVMITFLSGPAGGWSDRIGPRLQMIAGPVLVSVGMASFLLAGTHANYFAYFLPGQILFGLGMALVIAPLTKSALSVEPQFSGAASGVNNSISRIAAMLAIAILGVVALRVFQTDLEHRLTKSSLPSEVRQQILSQANKLGAIEIPTAPEPVRQEAENIIKNSFVHAFRWVLGITAALALLGAIISALTIPKKLPK